MLPGVMALENGVEALAVLLEASLAAEMARDSHGAEMPLAVLLEASLAAEMEIVLSAAGMMNALVSATSAVEMEITSQAAEMEIAL